MGALTQVYVETAINANSGTGTIGDPYGDLQWDATSREQNGQGGVEDDTG
jgi:hypothetical protein